jgi:hypothetical protein
MNPLQKEELQFVQTFLEDEEHEESTKQMFKVTDLNSLNWTFRKMAALKEKEKEIKQLAQKEKDRIEWWERSELSNVTQSLDFFQALISEYHASVLEENPKAKTLSTPYGKTKARKSKEAAEKVNEDVILQHVIESGMDDYLKTSLKWGDFKKELKIVEISGEKVIVDGNGQLVPGVTVKPENITFSVEVD